MTLGGKSCVQELELHTGSHQPSSLCVIHYHIIDIDIYISPFDCLPFGRPLWGADLLRYSWMVAYAEAAT